MKVTDPKTPKEGVVYAMGSKHTNKTYFQLIEGRWHYLDEAGDWMPTLVNPFVNNNGLPVKQVPPGWKGRKAEESEK